MTRLDPDLETMRPNPTWDPSAYEETVETLEATSDEVRYLVWGGDWCKDCRAMLPDFAAALAAADVPPDRVETIAVDTEKTGPKVSAYDIEYIPTIVVEDDEGTELVRFVESEDRPPAVWLTERLAESFV